MAKKKNAKSKGQVTFTHVKVPKSYKDMTPKEKWEWAGEVLGGLAPDKDSNS